MGTLSSCLKKIGLSEHESAILKGSAKDNVEDGDSQHVAAVRAVADYIEMLEKERASVVEQITANSGKAPDAPFKLKDLADLTAVLRGNAGVSEQPSSYVDNSEESSSDGVRRALPGGQEGINGYFYKGGQFLPSTMAEPGKWKVGKKWISSGKEMVAPGQWAVQPTPFSRSIYEIINAWTLINDGQMSLRKDIRGYDGNPITPETEIRPGVKGILGKEALSVGELIDAWNSGQRWFDVNPDVNVEDIQKDASAVNAEAELNPLDYTPKQYHEAYMARIANEYGLSASEVKEDYDTEAARNERNLEWINAVRAAARNGDELSRQTLDKLHELNDKAVAELMHDYPDAKLPSGYQVPDARKQEKQAAEDKKSDRAEIKNRSADAGDLSKVETGKPITLYYSRNTESSKGMAPAGMDFGQDIEPAGEYMNVEQYTELKAPTDKWISGVIRFNNPLVLEHKSTDSNGWKKDLSEMFGGKTGKSLSAAIKSSGYDGIITYDSYGLSETVNLSGIKYDSMDAAKNDSEKLIEDFGEKLEGARKDRSPSLSKEISDDDIASQPLSKIWPAAEIDAIENKFAAAVAFTAREEIPSKPRKSYLVARWVEKVKILRNIASSIMASTEEGARKLISQTSVTLAGFRAKVALLEAIDRDQWKRIGSVEEFPTAYRYGENGEQIKSPIVRVEIDGKRHTFDDATSVADVIEKVNGLLGVEQEAKKMQFEVRGRGNSYFINKKGDKEYRKLKEFTNTKDAFTFVKENYDELVAAWEGVKDRDNVTKADVRNAENRPRTGEDRRNGQDVTKEMFENAFGFRGVQFGEWVKQGGSAKERQWMLNQAYDALMDLADIVGIPPKAISLNGSLGLAFGARGNGNAAAHFEPGKLVINLTKTQGAGTFAHEWFHALDNYFSRQRNGEVKMSRSLDAKQAYRTSNYITYRPEPMMVHKTQVSTPITRAKLAEYHAKNPKSGYYNPENWKVDPNHPEGVRPEVERAFAELVEALDASPMRARSAKNDKVTDGYWSRIIERGARAFENYVIFKMMEKGYNNDYLANVREVQDFPRAKERYPYLLPEEVAPIAEAFDGLFSTVETKETDKGIAIYNLVDFKPLTEAEMLPTGQIVDTVNQLLEQFKADIPVTIIDREDDVLPAGPVGNNNVATTEWATSGFVYRGRIHLVREGLNDVESVASTLFHELLHYGIRRFVPEEQYIAEMQRLYKADPWIQRETKNWLNSAEGQEFYVKNGKDNSIAAARGVDEALAKLAEELHAERNRPGVTIGDKLASVVSNVMEWLSVLASKFGFGVVKERIIDLKASPEAREYVESIFKRLREGDNPPFMMTSKWAYSDPAFSVISKEYQGDTIDVDGVQRPRMNSEGRPIHPSEYGIRNFWRWFSPSPSQLLDGLSIAEVSSLKRDTEALADFIESQSSLPESDRFSVIPPSVFAHVSGVVNNRKILDAVVRSLPVDVVNFLSGKKLSAKEVLHDSAMLENMLSVDPASNVSLGVNPSRIAELAVRVIANAGAKISGLANGALKRNSAVLADTNDPVLGAHVRKSSSGDLGIIAGFGDSKVVDDQGRPLVVYHGTMKDFSEFDKSRFGKFDHGTVGLGVYATQNKGIANNYAREGSVIDGGNVMQIYMRLENPIGFDDAMRIKMEIASERQAAGEQYSSLEANIGRYLTNRLTNDGHDGVSPTKGEWEGVGESWVAFDPTQIKSATGNNGDFDPSASNIMFAKDAKSTSVSPAEIRAALIDRFGERGIKALESAGVLKIVRLKDAPDAMRALAEEQGASALYGADGVAYLFSDRMTTEDAPGKLLHEIGEHYGLERMLGADGWGRMKKRIVAMAKAKGSVAYGAWEGVKANYTEFANKSDSELAGNERFLHEVLAALGENKAGMQTSLWREMLAAVKAWLASKGLLVDWINEGDIANLVSGSLKKAMRDAEAGLVAPEKMESLVETYFRQIVSAMKAADQLIEDCA